MHGAVYAKQEKAQDRIPGRWNRNRVHGGGKGDRVFYTTWVGSAVR